MLIVYKYEVSANCDNSLWLPKGAKVLSVQIQNDRLQAWVLQNTCVTEWEAVTVAVWGTGIGIPDNGKLKYLNTCQTQDGTLVFHSFVRDDFWRM